MKGFKDFLMKGNLIELAVAFIMATAFAAVVEAFTGLILQIVAKIGGAQEVSKLAIGGVDLAPFINALIAFFIMALVIYFGIVKPYEIFKARTKGTVEEEPTTEGLLTQIRDLLAGR